MTILASVTISISIGKDEGSSTATRTLGTPAATTTSTNVSYITHLKWAPKSLMIGLNPTTVKVGSNEPLPMKGDNVSEIQTQAILLEKENFESVTHNCNIKIVGVCVSLGSNIHMYICIEKFPFISLVTIYVR